MTKASPGEGEAYPCTCEENGCSCEDVQRSATSLVSEENEKLAKLQMENAEIGSLWSRELYLMMKP